MSDMIVGMGEALWDVLPEGKKIGGAPANFAYHVSQFGFNSRVVSAVGDDKLGNEILENFSEKNLNFLIEKVPYPTGTVQVELDDEGIPCYDIKEGVAWDNIPFTPALEELAKQTRAVCFGSLAQRSVVSRETINKFLDAMPDDNGQLRIFDINLRQNFYTKEILCNSMERSLSGSFAHGNSPCNNTGVGKIRVRVRVQTQTDVDSVCAQLRLTLCTSMDGSLSESFVHGNSPCNNTGVGCHALLQGNLPNPGTEPMSPVSSELQADS